ncbi:14757_t:CDS:2, partial [Dentiscutata heterogama]
FSNVYNQSNQFAVDPLSPQVDASNQIQELTDNEDLIELEDTPFFVNDVTPKQHNTRSHKLVRVESEDKTNEPSIGEFSNLPEQDKASDKPKVPNKPTKKNIAPQKKNDRPSKIMELDEDTDEDSEDDIPNEEFEEEELEDKIFNFSNISECGFFNKYYSRNYDLVIYNKLYPIFEFKVAPEILNIKPLRITAPALMTSDNQNFNNNPKLSTDILIFYSDYEKDDDNAFGSNQSLSIDTKSVDFIEFTDFYSYNNDEIVEQSFNIKNLDPLHQIELENLLHNNSDVFTWTSNDLGRTGLTKHVIDTGDELPIKQRPYRRFPKEKDPSLNQLLRKDVAYNWGPSQQCAFKALKDKLSSSPILAFSRFDKEFILSTDASGYALGAILS